MKVGIASVVEDVALIQMAGEIMEGAVSWRACRDHQQHRPRCPDRGLQRLGLGVGDEPFRQDAYQFGYPIGGVVMAGHPEPMVRRIQGLVGTHPVQTNNADIRQFRHVVLF